MARPKLIYFDAPVSRGEECRLALHIAGVDFEDVRINRKDWAALKPTTPFGGVPILRVTGPTRTSAFERYTRVHRPRIRAAPAR